MVFLIEKDKITQDGVSLLLTTSLEYLGLVNKLSAEITIVVNVRLWIWGKFTTKTAGLVYYCEYER